MFSFGAYARDADYGPTPMMYTERSRRGPRRIQHNTQVRRWDNLQPRSTKKSMQDCTRHTVHPRPANLRALAQKLGVQQDPQSTAQSPSSPPSPGEDEYSVQKGGCQEPDEPHTHIPAGPAAALRKDTADGRTHK